MTTKGTLDLGAAPLVPLFELAQGGMGRVELAMLRQDRFVRLFAVKRLHPHLTADPGVRAMFVEEARVAGLIRHPHVVSVISAGTTEREPYLVMEYIEGVSVSAMIELAAKGGEAIPMQVCLRIIAEAARGLHAAHELVDVTGNRLDVIHRDVSPQNILVGFDGVTRVTDFGVAKVLDATAHTRTGALKGKLGYMAPERLRFETYDRRADLFALGVVLYELLTTQRLYRASTDEEAAGCILREPPPDVGLVREDTPASVVELLFRLLAKRAELRPAAALEVAERLEATLGELGSEEGGNEVAEYVSSRFASIRDDLRERISNVSSQRSAATPVAAAPVRLSSEPTGATRLSQRGRRTALFVTAGALGGALLTALLLEARSSVGVNASSVSFGNVAGSGGAATLSSRARPSEGRPPDELPSAPSTVASVAPVQVEARAAQSAPPRSISSGAARRPEPARRPPESKPKIQPWSW